MGGKMAESSMAIVSRRSTRYCTDTDGIMMETGEHRPGSSTSDDAERERSQRDARTSSTNIEPGMIPMVDLGKDLGGMFPKTMEDMGKQVTKSLQAAKVATKSKVDGRPLNFGTVLPGTIYRSSFPQIEDLQFLGSLGLKTIISLVNKEFSPQFRDFMRTHGIRHCVIEMQGTKKVEIPESVMQSIMEVVLDDSNHPLLIHCNHGKHRTGCAVAVVRHVAGWKVDEIVEEYTGHAEPKVRECDVQYITEYQVSSLEGLFIKKATHNPVIVMQSSKMMKLIIGTMAALLIWLLTWLLWDDQADGVS